MLVVTWHWPTCVLLGPLLLTYFWGTVTDKWRQTGSSMITDVSVHTSNTLDSPIAERRHMNESRLKTGIPRSRCSCRTPQTNVAITTGTRAGNCFCLHINWFGEEGHFSHRDRNSPPAARNAQCHFSTGTTRCTTVSQTTWWGAARRSRTLPLGRWRALCDANASVQHMTYEKGSIVTF